MRCNELWRNEFQVIKTQSYMEDSLLTLNEADMLFNRRVFDIYGCLVLDITLDRTAKIELTKEQFEKVLQNNLDRTGYEYSNNEFRVVDYIKRDMNKDEQYLLSMMYIKHLNARLTLMTKQKINYVLFFTDDALQIRFYQEWEGEPQLHIENLEDYKDPVAIYTSDELSGFI